MKMGAGWRVLTSALLALGGALVGCAAVVEPTPPLQGEVPAPAAVPVAPVTPKPSGDAGMAGAACVGLTPGCPCTVEGEQVQCGVNHDRIGDYVRCAPAYITCSEGTWSACVGDNIIGR